MARPTDMTVMPEEKQTPELGSVPVGAVYRAVERGLGEVVPGLEVLDRDLELTRELSANLVARDAPGHLILVLLAEGDASDLSLVALDALRFARDNRTLLSRHLGDEGVRMDLPARVYLVSESFDDLLVGRLAPLLGRDVELFEVRTLRSARGEQAYLVRVLPHDEPVAPEREGTGAFLAALPDELRDIARLVVRRLSRIDAELDRSSTADQVLWRGGEEVLARLAWEDGVLRGLVPSRGSSHPLRSERDVDPYVEEVLSRYVEGLEDAGSPPQSLELTDPLDAPAAPPEVVLSAEELEAFQD